MMGRATFQAGVLSVTVPGQPIPKGRPRVTRTGHAYTPQRTVQAEEALGWAMKLAWCRPPSAAYFQVDMKFYMATKRRVDGDNLVKCVMDAGNNIVWVDDSQIRKHSCEVLIDRDEPRTEIVIRRIE